MKYLGILALLSIAGCTTVSESIAPYKEPTVRCKISQAVPIAQDGLPIAGVAALASIEEELSDDAQ